MDNRDIFDFDFVDRTKEQILLNRFLNNEFKENFLWIDGHSGIGKTFLLENVLLVKKICHISILSYLRKMKQKNV